MTTYLPCIVSFFACLVLTPVVKLISIKKGLLSYPKEDRWHKKPTALLGGIAIYVSFSLPLFFQLDFGTVIPHLAERGINPISPPSFAAVVWIGATLLFLLGIVDDFYHIKPHSKLVGQIITAAVVTYLGFRLNWFESLSLDMMITIIWIIGISNAFNLIDNMDGLCAGIACIATFFLCVIYFENFPEFSMVGFALAGSLAGFLIYNFNPASIFMGDCGSLFIGFTLAMLTLQYPQSGMGHGISIYAVPIILLIVPVFDTTMVTIIRTLSGRKASTGGKDHTSHRLVLLGFSEKNAVLFLYGIGVVSGIAALFVNKADTMTSPTVIAPLGLSFLLLGTYLAQLRVYPEKEFSSLRDRAYTPILIELTYKKHLLLVLLDLGIITFSYYLSYRLILDAQDINVYFDAFLSSLPVIIACKIVVFFTSGVYRGIWRHMSSNDVFVYLKASFLGSIISVALVAIIFKFENFPKSIILIDWMITTGLLLGTRGSFRLFVDTMKRSSLEGDAVLIYGAGCGGEILLREILNNKSYRLKPVGFIDDDPLKKGKKILGYNVLGKLKDLEKISSERSINGIIVSFSRVKQAEHMVILGEYCSRKGIFLKRLSINISTFDLGITG